MAKTRRTLLAALLTVCQWATLPAGAQVLADFEDGTWGQLKLNKDYTGALFATKPTIMDNPNPSGLNSSARCAGAVNKADADWWKNFMILELQQPVTIDDSNRMLSLLAYRSIQPKDMRIGFNTEQESGEVYYGKLTADATWERLTIDLGEKFYGRKLEKLVIVLSCNWSDPRSGWGEATYCFDDITLSGTDSPQGAAVRVDATQTFQTMRDFGASDCWTADFIGKYFSAEQREKAARWLFSRDVDAQGNPQGIGLSCWRVNVGAGSSTQGAASNIDDETRRSECFLSADGSYDWTRQQGQQWFMQQAKQYGVDHFLLFSNSAPIHFTKNGKANANNQSIKCNLKDDCYDDFAEFLATTVQHFSGEGYNISYIDPVNEPQFDWKDGQEGSPWENANIAQLARELDKSLQSRGLQTKILLPEAAKLTCLYGGSEARGNRQIEAFFGTGNSTYIGDLPSLLPAVAGHSYWTFTNNSDLQTVRERVRDEAAKYGVEVMQTEWSMLDAAPSTGAGFPASYEAATKMDIALYMGKLIHCDLTFGNMTGWHYWTAFAQEKWSQKNRFYLVRVNAQGDTADESYGDIKRGGTLTADKNLWVLGNYSRFVRPGYRRVAIDGASEMNGLLGSAWLSPDGSQLAVVFVNMSRAPRRIDLSMASGQVQSIAKYVTDADHNLERDTDVQDPGALQLPARSVTTFVIATGGIAGISDPVATLPAAGGRRGIYTLSGVRVQQAARGVYIRDGKKYVAR